MLDDASAPDETINGSDSSRQPKVMPSVVIQAATFSDGTVVNFDDNNIVVLVGPNNAGKSVALRNMKDKSTKKEISGLVVKDLTLKTLGSEAELLDWLEENF